MRPALPVLLALAACSPDDDAPDDTAADDTTGDTASAEVADPATLGPHPVGHATFDAVDAARSDRLLVTDVWYPAPARFADEAPDGGYELAPGIALPSAVAHDEPPVAAGPWPLLVFSHGYDAIRTQSAELLEAVASHGFVIVSADHLGNTQSSPDDDFDTAASNRVPDVSFLIDAMLARSGDAEDDFAARLDPERIGVLGHSFGGMTALGVAAGWAGAPPDDRVDAIVPISAVVDGDLQDEERPSDNAGFSDTALATVQVPVLLVGGTRDTDVPIENNALAVQGLGNAPALLRLDVIGATHTHFANVCAIGARLLNLGFDTDVWATLGAGDLLGPYEETCGPGALDMDVALRVTQQATVAFLRRYLNDERGYDAWLTPEAFDDAEATFTVARAPGGG